MRFVSLLQPTGGDGPAWWFLFRDGRLYLRATEATAEVPQVVRPEAELGVGVERPIYLGALDGLDAYAGALSGEPPEAARLSPLGLRVLHGRVDDEVFALAGRAFQLLEWDRTHRHCGVCGTPTEPATGERALRCPRCEHLHFPRVSPAVIVRVTRGDQVLLAHGVGFPEGVYSVLAGFVEPGETLEEAVAREVGEETGIRVTDIRYFGSQPWPFPHQIMIGFTARHESGEVHPDELEIADAGWFTADALPSIPPKLSIARRLIDDFLAATG